MLCLDQTPPLSRNLVTIFAGFHKRQAGHGLFPPPAHPFSLNYQRLFVAALHGINPADGPDVTVIGRYAGGQS
ncbi:MAG TPA: hypothetical protein VJ805_07925 [Nitrospiraceae bacterium]|nr:hypothetical protein [Nitrospiraceae bacterium]